MRLSAPRDRDRVGAARKKPFAPQRWPYEREQLARRIHQMYAKEYSDPEIAVKLGVGVATVGRWRKELGLPPRGHKSERYKQRVRETTRKQLRSMGLPSLIQLRLLVQRVENAKRGRPC